MPNVMTGRKAALSSNLGIRIRDQILQNESLIVETVNEVIRGLEPHRAEFYRRRLHESKSFGAAIKRVTVEVGVVLTLAKTLVADEDFSSASSLLHDIDFSVHNGKVLDFAASMVNADLVESRSPEQTETIYHLVPKEVIERRLVLVQAFLAQAALRVAH